MIYYFSGTGNSKYIAEKLAEYTKDSIQFIPEVFDKMEEDIVAEDGDVFGVVFPIYAWAVPQIVVEFLSHVKLSKNVFSYCIGTCAKEAGKALSEVQKVLHFKSCYSFVMPENFVALLNIDEEVRAKEKVSLALQKLPKVASEIIAKKNVYDVNEGAIALFKTQVINKIFSRFMLTSSFFSVDEKCISCGKCVSNCPFGVISLENGKPVFEGKCQMCMSCISKCPKAAIQCCFSKNKKRYLFEEPRETGAIVFQGDREMKIQSNDNAAKQKDNEVNVTSVKSKDNEIKMSSENSIDELKLKYGCNPHQENARIFIANKALPISVLNGRASYINLLDALNGWQLVKELAEVTNLPSATSFKHVSPAGAAIGLPLSDELKRAYFVDSSVELSPLSCAYARARGADRMSSFGDFIALSEPCDVPTARLISKEVSDGIIAPDYEPEALAILCAKKKGAYTVIQMDKDYVPSVQEKKDVFGITFEQSRNNCKITESILDNVVTQNKYISDSDKRNLLIALIILKYTQSNSVCYVKDGQAIGIGAGQQSRIHCTRLAGNKADVWYLRQAPQVLNLSFRVGLSRAERDNAIDVFVSDDYMDVLQDGEWQKIFLEKPEVFSKEEKQKWLSSNRAVALASDAFFPFGDNIERARKSGVSFIAQPGGSLRDDNVIQTCNKYGIAMAFTGLRLFHH
ncbi:MAG: phosphoribosylaminoimidazolecarboxamide formyltransferase [Treponema sp.]|nr:phosphoribosylaminoimidazolecarboxamide formyltransferase [Treponema sp.]